MDQIYLTTDTYVYARTHWIYLPQKTLWLVQGPKQETVEGRGTKYVSV